MHLGDLSSRRTTIMDNWIVRLSSRRSRSESLERGSPSSFVSSNNYNVCYNNIFIIIFCKMQAFFLLSFHHATDASRQLVAQVHDKSVILRLSSRRSRSGSFEVRPSLRLSYHEIIIAYVTTIILQLFCLVPSTYIYIYIYIYISFSLGILQMHHAGSSRGSCEN